MTGIPNSAARTVVIQGGLFATKHSYDALAASLVARGFEVVVSPIRRLGMQSIQRDAANLADTVATASATSLARGGDGRVSILAHSKGGVSARWYLQRMGGFEHVDQLLTLSSPNRGTMPIGTRLSHLAGRFSGIRPVMDMVADGPLMRGLVADLPADMAAARRANPQARIVSFASNWNVPMAHGSDGFIKLREARITPNGIADARLGASLGFEDVTVRGLHHNAMGGRTGSAEPIMDQVASKLRRET
ncbi:MAG: hypothetical protein JWM98_1222 [Thermoleophilia bacterium]|nr:hypothetical protein [Thermoleophilia bacterium]